MFAGAVRTAAGGDAYLRAVEQQGAAAFALFPADWHLRLSASGSLLLQQSRFTGTGSPGRDERPFDPHEDAIAFWGRLDGRAALAARLGIDGAASDLALVRSAWARWGTETPQHLTGDFALAIVSRRDGSLFLGRDALGVKPLYYRVDPAGIAFATSISALKIPDLPLTADPEWMARYLWMDLSVDGERTAYREIRKLKPGHTLVAERGHAPQVRRWHDWRDDAPPGAVRDVRWIEGYRAVLDEAVQDRTSGARLVGVETSGGIDSSAILAIGARTLDDAPSRLRTYGFALCEEEPALALATSQAFGLRHNFISTGVAAPSKAVVDRTLAALGQPEENGNASGHAIFYEQAAREDVRVLLSGFGGDETVSNQATKARHEFMAARNIPALFGSFPGGPPARALRTARFIGNARRSHTFDRALDAEWNAVWPTCLLRDEVAEAFDLERRYLDTARHDAPYRRVNDVLLHYHLERMAMTTRLENCTLVAAAWGVEYRWPLLDARLIQQFLSTPSIEKIGPGGIGRYLHRRAIADIVPSRVAWKPGKEMGANVVPRGHLLADPIWGSAAALRDGMDAEVAALVDPAKLEAGLALIASVPAFTPQVLAVRSSLVALHWLNRWRRLDRDRPTAPSDRPAGFVASPD